MHRFQRIFLWSYKYLSTLFTIIKHFLYLNDVFFANTLGDVSEKYQVWGWGAKFFLLPTLLSSADREMGLAQRKVVPSTTTKSFLWTSFSRLCISALSSNNRHGKGRTSRRGDNENYIHVVTFLFLHYVIHERLLLEDKYIWSISKLLYNLDYSLLSLSPSFLHIHFYRGHVRNVIQIIMAHNILMFPSE